MVEPPTHTPTDGLNRLITFELDADETLLVRAGRDEMDNRTIYRGDASGRYAIIPVDELGPTLDSNQDADIDVDLGQLQIVGDTIAIQDHTSTRAGLQVNGEPIVSRGSPGIYGLLYVPSTE